MGYIIARRSRQLSYSEYRISEDVILSLISVFITPYHIPIHVFS